MTRLEENFDGNDQERMISPRLTDLLVDLAYAEDSGELQVVELHEGDVLFEQGDEADRMYVLKAGVLGVRVRHDDGSESNIARIGPGGIVGEMALLSGSRRSATVYAINDAGLLCVSQDQFENLMMEDEPALVEMSETAVPRWQRQQLFRALHRLLGDVDSEALEALRQQMTWHYFNNGEVVFLQGDDPDGMYIVVNGRLRASLLREDGTVKDIGRIGPGEPVGEMGVISAAERSATIHAIRESNLVHITPAKFERLIRRYPKLLLNITRVIIERQRRLLQGTETEQAGPLTLAVIPSGIKVDTMPFAAALSAGLSRCGSTLLLDSMAFDERYGEDLASQTELDDVGNTAVVAFMNELDLAHPYTIYVADPFASAWTRRCIGHADRVIILAGLAGDPRPGDAERLLDDFEVPLPRDLVFWGNFSAESPPDVSAWLAPRALTDAHIIAKSNEEELRRLVQLLTINQ